MSHARVCVHIFLCPEAIVVVTKNGHCLTFLAWMDLNIFLSKDDVFGYSSVSDRRNFPSSTYTYTLTVYLEESEYSLSSVPLGHFWFK